MSNYYEILGININADAEQIKKAFRKQSLIYHPDKNNNDTEKCNKFKLINEAYSILSDDHKKMNYDIENHFNSFNKLSGLQGLQGLQGFSELSEQFLKKFNSSNHQNTSNISNEMNELFVKDILKQQYYNNFFNDTTNIRDCDVNNHNVSNFAKNYKKPKSIHITIQLSLEQTYTGTKIPIEINRNIKEMNECYEEIETIYITIPPGTDENEMLTIKEKGNSINGMYGDIKIKFKLINNEHYKRIGLNLIYTKYISFKESICGFTFQLTHINNKLYTINNTNGIVIHNNYITTIPNMVFSKENITGNLLIYYKINYPEKLDIAIIEKLREIL